MLNHKLMFAMVAGGVVGVMGLAGAAEGAIIDLTTPNSSGMLNGAVFQHNTEQAAGTGIYEPFVRIRMNGFEEGYNTSNNDLPFDELAGIWTRDIQVQDLLTVERDGITYYDFRLDINESRGGTQSLLSLDEIQIYTSPIGSQNTTNVASLGTLRYDLDAGGDNWVKLEYELNAGSGVGDMTLLVPVTAFAGAAPSDYVYLYSAFGTNHSSSAGFEEWAIRGVPIPAPGPLVVASLGLVLITKRRR
ncbi:MAG TPA: hypothetical protein VD997_16515 [Phycisphaerales bacterium]|nr:hypothetical protein [Phycisphaerales bacterium]